MFLIPVTRPVIVPVFVSPNVPHGAATRRRTAEAVVGATAVQRRHHRNMAHGPEPPASRGYRLYQLLLCGLLMAAMFNWKL